MHFSKEFDVAAVIGGNADGPYIFLNGSPHDGAGAAMVAQIDDFDAMADEFKIDGIDGTVVAIADGNRGEEPNWWSFCHYEDPQIITTLVVTEPPMLKVRKRLAPGI